MIAENWKTAEYPTTINELFLRPCLQGEFSLVDRITLLFSFPLRWDTRTKELSQLPVTMHLHINRALNYLRQIYYQIRQWIIYAIQINELSQADVKVFYCLSS